MSKDMVANSELEFWMLAAKERGDALEKLRSKLTETRAALEKCREELLVWKEDIACDHSVGVCACRTIKALELADEALSK